MDRKQLIKEIEQVPEPLLNEIHDFVSLLKARVRKERMDTALASESSLKKDWLCAEERSGMAEFVEAMLQKEGDMRKALIHSDPAVMMGKPVIAGTRITVESILEKLAAGETVEQVLAAHPRLTQIYLGGAEVRGEGPAR